VILSTCNTYWMLSYKVTVGIVTKFTKLHNIICITMLELIQETLDLRQNPYHAMSKRAHVEHRIAC